MESVVPESNPKEEKFVEEKDVDVQSKQSPNDSEYDSADSYSANGEDDDDDDDNRVRSRQSGVDGGGSRSVSETEEGSVGLERESGDGQESVPAKKVDDDEDKKNPQYIPKRGTFYEHDDRTADDNDSPKTEEVEKEKESSKKKVWQDKKERWSHDRFNDTEQAPKSRAELVSAYGYDIRNEDGPPRARRRRRYGRGPNKYTRNWEDEDAYSKPPTSRLKPVPRKPSRGGGGGGGGGGDNVVSNANHRGRRTNATSTGEDFPQLSSSAANTKDTTTSGGYKEINRRECDKDNNRQSSERAISETNGNIHAPTTSTSNPDSTSERSHNHDNNQVNKSQSLPPQQQQQQQQRVGSGRVIKPKREIQDSDYRGFTTKTRQYRNIKTEQKILPRAQQHQQQQQSTRNDDFIQSQNFTNKQSNSQDLDKDLGKLSLHDTYKNHKHGNGGGNNQRQGSVPPRLQAEQKGSKRYSSIRQRSLPESQTPPFSQHSNYYPNEYNQQNQVSQQTIIHQQNTQIHPSTNQVPQPPPPQIAPPPPPPLAPIPQQVPVTATTILQAAPPQFAPPPFPQGPPPPPPPTAYLQASVTGPPTFLPQQTPQIINYVPSQQFPQTYQGYQQQFNPVVTQPTELYQQPSGITYYSADQQVTQQRVVPQKRPKAAIPIVAPPQFDLKDKRDDLSAAPLSEDGVDDTSSNNNNNDNSIITATSTTVEQEVGQQ